MRLTIESTAEVVDIDGVTVRTWHGRTAGNVPVLVYVRSLSPQSRDPAVAAEFGRELEEIAAPRNMTVSILPSVRMPTAPAIGGNTFDAVAAWRAMPDVVRDMIGALAIVERISDLGGCIAQETRDPEAWRWFEAAASESASRLSEIVTAVLLGGDSETMPPRPDLRPLGIAQCRVCGCTEEIGCADGCRWVEPDLCSSHGPFLAEPEG